jgi:hypothetical protein
MALDTENPPTTAAIVQQLATLDQADLVTLLCELCDRSAETRAFLAIRLLGQPDGGSTLDSYRQYIERVFYPPDDDYAVPDIATLTRTRTHIQHYHQATGDLIGTIDLLLMFVEYSTHLLWQFQELGDDYEEHIGQSYHDLADLLRTPDGTDTYPRFRERLIALVKKADEMGWGHGDTAAESLYEVLYDMEGTDEEAWGLE